MRLLLCTLTFGLLLGCNPSENTPVSNEMDTGASEKSVAKTGHGGSTSKSSDEHAGHDHESDKAHQATEQPHLASVTDSDFQKVVLQSDKPVVVDFWAPWCGPCLKLTPVMEQVAADQSQAHVVKVNVDNATEVASKYKVESIPALLVFKDGKEIDRLIGLHQKAEVMEFICDAIEE